MITLNTILFALLGGILPALLWLMSWLREDALHPESNSTISKAFLCGMFVVLLVLPFQKLVDNFFPGMGPTAFLLWAILEEGFKFAAAYLVAIRLREDDEPIDPMIYMITTALGFVALENALFIINPLLQQDVASALSTGSMRFIGASLLHVVSSSCIGVAFALSFYKTHRQRVLFVFTGFGLAVLVHTAFNLLIINQTDWATLKTFGVVWAGVTLLLLFFEKAKSIKKDRLSTLNTSAGGTAGV